MTASTLATSIKGRRYEFASLKQLLAKAGEEKSGDRLAGIAAKSEAERVAAKCVLAEVSLAAIRDQPVLAYEDDEVTRIILDSLDPVAYQSIASFTVSDLREFLLSDKTSLEDIVKIQKGLTGEMVAACAKLMSNMDLVLAAKKCRVIARAKTTLGLPGRLSARLQPNHPSDAIEGIRASIYEGLSYGIGDAVIGINPVYDTADTVARLLTEVDKYNFGSRAADTKLRAFSYHYSNQSGRSGRTCRFDFFKALPAAKRATAPSVSTSNLSSEQMLSTTKTAAVACISKPVRARSYLRFRTTMPTN